jgi:hypothetical protein
MDERMRFVAHLLDGEKMAYAPSSGFLARPATRSTIAIRITRSTA